jgi:hypothetical protein
MPIMDAMPINLANLRAVSILIPLRGFSPEGILLARATLSH